MGVHGRLSRGGQKYIICNGDEGDPGAFMDRAVMESDPHRIIEGMAIAGYATGADHGFIYVRAEYPLAVKRLKWAISRGDVDRSPMEGMETPQAVKPRERWLSDEELGRIWVQAPKCHRCFGPIVRLLIVTGQRREEITGLHWDELDRDQRELGSLATERKMASRLPSH